MTQEEKNFVHNELRAMKRFSEISIQHSIINKIGEKTYEINVPIPVQEFMQNVLITELAGVIKASAWLGFVCIGCGIEFLGKCIDAIFPLSWDEPNQSRRNFNDALIQLDGLNKYSQLIKRTDGFDLYDQFRCGLIHGLAPKAMVSISHGKTEMANIVEYDGKVNFNIDELYDHFVIACKQVMYMPIADPTNSKMNRSNIFVNVTISK